MPHVVVHVAVSLDGAATGFEPDQARFYGLVRTWSEDVTLVGADTILAQEPALRSAPGPGPAADGPLLAVVDGRHRVTEWEALRNAGHWRDVLPLHAAPGSRVDLAAALSSFGDSVVRVDSGGSLTGALLAQGLLDEVSLLVHPVFADPAGDHRWYGPTPPPAGTLVLIATETFADGLVWLRYRLGAENR